MAPQPTSRYDTSIKVKQEVIDRIKNMGMASAVGAANSGKESADFVEGAKRMYGNRVGAQNPANLNKAQNVAATNPLARRAPSVDGGPSASGKPASIPMPKSAPATAARRTSSPPPGLSAANVEGAKNIGNTINKVQQKIGGQSLGEQNAGTASANLVKGAGKGIRNLYRDITNSRNKSRS